MDGVRSLVDFQRLELTKYFVKFIQDFENDPPIKVVIESVLYLHGILNNHLIPNMRSATFTLMTFCMGQPQPLFDKVEPALQVLARLINSEDERIVMYACCALSCLSHGTNEKIQAVLNSGVCPGLIKLLAHPSPFILNPVLRTFGNILTGGFLQTQAVISADLIDPLVHLLLRANVDLKEEAGRAVSNLMVHCSLDQIKYEVVTR